jgi:serpin B
MTANGAAGTTADEMSRVLGIGGSGRPEIAAYNGGLNALTQAVESLAGSFDRGDGDSAVIALDSANALFGDRSVSWRADFVDRLAESYGAGMLAVDFVHDAETARKAVNSWTAEQTHDRIPQILGPGTVTEVTRLVLVNALYFKAPWASQFEPTSTSDEPFHLPDGSTVTVPTMHGAVDVGGFGHGDGLVAVRLPYYTGSLAMTVLLPDEGRLPDLEAVVGGGGLGDLLALPQPANVRLSMPRWTFRTAAVLDDALAALGMPTAFGDLADFSRMNDDENVLHIGTVAHEVFVAVDEQGTEAAAATAVGMSEATSVPDYVEVTVDRPFLFVVHDVEHGTPLFVGRVADPSA